MTAASSAQSQSLLYVTSGPTRDINKEYFLGKQIGQPGQFGYAVIATHRATNKRYAVKVINKGKFSRIAEKKMHFEELRTEIEILHKMHHRNIIKLYDVFETSSELYLVQELCTGGELFDRIKAQGSYNELDASRVLRQICQGLAYLHKNLIAHCDLKPDNFLFVNEELTADVKIIDFGMSKFVKRRHYFHALRGTPYYIAPEVIAGEYSYHCDMWSFGVVMFVILFGYPPFHGANDDEIFGKIMNGFEPVVRKGYGAHFPADIKCSRAAKDLMSKLLTRDTARRFTADEALQHPWLTGEDASLEPIVVNVVNNIRVFQANTKFKRGILNLMTNSLTTEELAAVRAAFAEMDEDGDGHITISELAHSLQKNGTNASMEQVTELMRMADIDGDGTLSYDELVLTSVQRKLTAKEERLWNAFQKVDLDHNGRLTIEEIEKVFGINSAIAKQMIMEADANGDGQIDFDEFLELWTSSNSNDSAAAGSKFSASKIRKTPVTS